MCVGVAVLMYLCLVVLRLSVCVVSCVLLSFLVGFCVHLCSTVRVLLCFFCVLCVLLLFLLVFLLFLVLVCCDCFRFFLCMVLCVVVPVCFCASCLCCLVRYLLLSFVSWWFLYVAALACMRSECFVVCLCSQSLFAFECCVGVFCALLFFCLSLLCSCWYLCCLLFRVSAVPAVSCAAGVVVVVAVCFLLRELCFFHVCSVFSCLLWLLLFLVFAPVLCFSCCCVSPVALSCCLLMWLLWFLFVVVFVGALLFAFAVICFWI